jgi:ADP-ribosylation factor-like protein 1
MGFIFSKIFSVLFSNQEVRLLILGLDNAGKTTLLYQMQFGEVKVTVPTLGFNVESVKYENLTFQMWDLGGQTEIRPYWRCYYPKTNAVVFVIDSSDKERIDISKQELFLLLQEEDLKGVPIAILANKQDMKGCLTDVQITELMGLTEIKNRKWAIFNTIAKTGKGLDDAFKWLTSILKNDNK